MIENEKTPVLTASIEQLARDASEFGPHKITPEMIQADIAAGAPVNADGSLDVVLYCAWLLKQEKRRHG